MAYNVKFPANTSRRGQGAGVSIDIISINHNEFCFNIFATYYFLHNSKFKQRIGIFSPRNTRLVCILLENFVKSKTNKSIQSSSLLLKFHEWQNVWSDLESYIVSSGSGRHKHVRLLPLPFCFSLSPCWMTKTGNNKIYIQYNSLSKTVPVDQHYKIQMHFLHLHTM